MFRTRKGKFSCELSLDTLQSLLNDIKEIAVNFNKTSDTNENKNADSLVDQIKTNRKTHQLRHEDIVTLPLDYLLSEQAIKN